MVKLNEDDKKQAKAEENAQKESAKQEKKKAPAQAVKAPIKTNATLADLNVVYFPLVTEKAVNMIDAENKITFIVSDKSKKTDIKKVIEGAYGVKVAKINTVRDMKGRKKAIVKLAKGFKAEELATKLGVL
jgi:large subunit ribosomal protein L23